MYIDDKTARELSKITKEEWESILNLSQTMLEKRLDVGVKMNEWNYILNLSRTMLAIRFDEGVRREGDNQQNQINEEQRIHVKIKELLQKVGLPPHLLGHKYLEEAIYVCYTDEKYGFYITKRLYPYIAKKFETTPTRVERAIRHSIEYAYTNGNFEILNQVFTGTRYDQGKPTNSHAIAALTEYLKMHNV